MSDTLEQRRFHLGDIISAAFGVLVSPRHMDGVYDTLNFLTGDSLYTHQLPRACRTVQPYVLDQHPQLAPLAEAVKDVTPENWRIWLDDQIAKYGEYLELQPVPQKAWLHVDALTEAKLIIGKDRVIPIQID